MEVFQKKPISPLPTVIFITLRAPKARSSTTLIYQPIEVSRGETYTYDMTLTAKGKAWGWIQVYISQWEPEEGKDFNDGKVFDLSGEIKTPKSGLMSELASGEKTYTATKSW